MRPPARAGARPVSGDDVTAFISGVRGEMNEIRTMVRELLDRPAGDGKPSPGYPDVPEELREYYTSLIQSQVAEEIVRQVVAEARERLAGKKVVLVASGGNLSLENLKAILQSAA